MATVSRRAPVRKSRSTSARKTPNCPTCGGPLTVVRDDDTLTTYVCSRCSKRKVAEWVASDAGSKAVRAAARKFKGLLLPGTDLCDLEGDTVLGLLEHDCPPAVGSDAFGPWLEAVAKSCAGKLRTQELEQPKAVEVAVLGTVAEDDGGDDEPGFVNAADYAAWEAKFLDARRKRIARVLSKLTASQRAAVKAKFFTRKPNLAAVARDSGRCPSAERMNLFRAMQKIRQLVDIDGYAAAA